MGELEFLAELNGPEYYEVFGTGERHGSLEKTWYRKNLDFPRFVTIALTLEGGALYRVEVWMGADDGEHFARHLVARFDGVNIQKLEDIKSNLEDAVASGAKHAEFLRKRDLTGSHILLRNSAKTT